MLRSGDQSMKPSHSLIGTCPMLTWITNIIYQTRCLPDGERHTPPFVPHIQSLVSRICALTSLPASATLFRNSPIVANSASL